MRWVAYIPDLSDDQTRGVSEVFRDIGQVALASVVVPAFIPNVNPVFLGFGVIVIFGAWITSIILLRNV